MQLASSTPPAGSHGETPGVPERLAAPDVPDARNDALVEERLPIARRWSARRRFATIASPSSSGARMSGPSAETRRADVSSTAPPRTPPSPLARQREPRRAAYRSVGRHRPPAPRHAKMAAQHAAALEAQQQVLAASLDGFEAPPVEPLGDSRRASPRVHGFDGQSLPDEGAKPRGRAMDGVAFRHRVRAGAPPAAARPRSRLRAGSA